MKRNKFVSFTLSMPNVGSWDGRWSGSERNYVLVQSLKVAVANPILKRGNYHYSFGDGWSASISTKEVDGNESRRLRRKSDGFCGYNWMVSTIVKYGKILNSNDVAELEKGEKENENNI